MKKAVTAVLGSLMIGVGCLVASVSNGAPAVALLGLGFSVVGATCFVHLGELL